jgi:hypothetical protein
MSARNRPPMRRPRGHTGASPHRRSSTVTGRAVAAYRFGHSIIRPFYVINQSTLDRGGVPVFGPEGGFNLNGGRPIPADLVMEWKNILPALLVFFQEDERTEGWCGQGRDRC